MQRRERGVKDEFDLSLEGRKPIVPRGHQKPYLDAIRTQPMTIGVGPAGSGKTFVAASWAIEQLVYGKAESIVLTRPLVTISSESIGFLPGKLENKMEPWTAPIFDVFYERIGVPRTQDLLKTQKIRIVPFGFMRGRTFKDCVVLVDEAQNMTPAQAKALVTRIGENCTYIINGDLTQTDLVGMNGLELLLQTIERKGLPVPVIAFTEKDVVRSALCKMWVEAFSG